MNTKSNNTWSSYYFREKVLREFFLNLCKFTIIVKIQKTTLTKFSWKQALLVNINREIDIGNISFFSTNFKWKFRLYTPRVTFLWSTSIWNNFSRFADDRFFHSFMKRNRQLQQILQQHDWNIIFMRNLQVQ